MIEFIDVFKSYYRSNLKAVDGINFRVEKGKIFGFLGPNGAGKTTTIKLIIGALKPDRGKILIGGFDITENPLEVKKLISYVPDDLNIFNRLTGVEYLQFVADMYEMNRVVRQSNVEKYSKIFGIYDALNMKIESYSHGMKRKLFIVGALMHDPIVLIMDEPFNGLDVKATVDLKDILHSLKKEGKTVFFSTHMLNIAEDICDEIAIIKRGKIIYEGTLADLKLQKNNLYDLEKIYVEMMKNE
ncbi:MAG: ABC transporter related [Thermoanaerobacterium thermosaccharolyticum]|jgi:ABC-2 type transport system ATP-binding protein